MKKLWKFLLAGSAVFCTILVVSAAAVAGETPAPSEITEPLRASPQGKVENATQDDQMAQVNSVSALSDVQPTDWAFQALQSLVERYGCIAGYPNGTYRGNRAMTRYEFAAGLNACLNRVNELIATATSEVVNKDDLATLQKLQEQYSAELTALRGRVDVVEAKTAELEAHQFSTTTKLVGEAIFAVTDVFGSRAGDRNGAVFQDRVRLDLQTSFTGQDTLHTRLATGNGGNTRRFDLGTAVFNGRTTSEGIQTFNITGNGETNNNNSVSVDWLAYFVPIGPTRLYIAGYGGIQSDYVPTINPYFEDTDGGNGALSSFASESPIYRIGGGSGAGININFGKGGGILQQSSITLGYLASSPNNPSLGSGLFNGNYAALGQFNINLGDRLELAATYVHGYHSAGSALFDAGGIVDSNVGVVGTAQANTLANASSSNSYGLEAAFRANQKLSISGFFSYHNIVGETGNNRNFEAWSYGAGVALPDFGKKGNVLGLFAGAEPYARGRVRGANDIPLHVEGFYKYRVSDNISITPGVIWLNAPGQNSDNKDAFIGTLRTTFTF
ncbi:MAG: iron uptake porin [Stigonema ocellatum SAG 48.90 = DSM 106950]|nr:iron uptake porin [Stigonema ocellatum SAG 48.90 = DSM 106950]